MITLKRIAASALLLFVISGCTRTTPSDMPPLYPCKVTVIQDDKPLAGAVVTLRFADESVAASFSQPWIPSGQTDADGTASLMTNARYPGAPLGQFKILVQKTDSEPVGMPPKPAEGTPQYEAWSLRLGSADYNHFDLVEQQYGDPQTTPLEIEVKKKGPNTATVDVGKPIRIKQM